MVSVFCQVFHDGWEGAREYTVKVSFTVYSLGGSDGRRDHTGIMKQIIYSLVKGEAAHIAAWGEGGVLLVADWAVACAVVLPVQVPSLPSWLVANQSPSWLVAWVIEVGLS